MTRLCLLLGGTGLLAATPVAAQDDYSRSVTPYVEVSQAVLMDLTNDDTVTYTGVAVGVDATIQSRRVAGQLSYRYEHQFGWGDFGDADIHSGLGLISAKVTPHLQLDAGGLAARARADIRGDAPGPFGGAVNRTNLYSLFAGPTFATRVGVANVNAAYRIGYTKVEAPDATGVPAGQPRLDYYDSAVNHLATASVGVGAGDLLPVGLTVSGAWTREDVSQLDQRFDGKYARADAVLPVSPELAVVGGAGYEDIEISQRDALVDPDGLPVLDGNGRFVAAPGSPRRLAYDFDGIFWDAGVLWRPSQRTTLEARVGRRYGTMTYLGSFSYAIDRTSGIQIGVYDVVDSIGRGLSRSLQDLPTSFNTRPDPFGDQFTGCVFGQQGSAAGGCLTPVLGALTTAQFRARGVDGVYATQRGPYRLGVGAGYVNRRFLTPGAPNGVNLSGTIDEIYYAQAFAGRTLSPASAIDVNAFVNVFDSGISGAPNVTAGGATGTYSYSFGRLGTSASLGVYGYDQDGGENNWSAQALLAARYSF